MAQDVQIILVHQRRCITILVFLAGVAMKQRVLVFLIWYPVETRRMLFCSLIENASNLCVVL